MSTTVRNHLGPPLERHRGRPRRRAGRRRFAARERGRRARRPSRTPSDPRCRPLRPRRSTASRSSRVSEQTKVDRSSGPIGGTGRGSRRAMRAGQNPVERDEMAERGSPSSPILPDHRLWSGDQQFSSQLSCRFSDPRPSPPRPVTSLHHVQNARGFTEGDRCLLARSQYPGSAARGTTGGFHATGCHRTYRLREPHLLDGDF